MSLRELVRRELAGLRAYVPKPRRETDVLLDANESPHPLPAEARAALAAKLAEIDLHRYPDPRARALRTALGARFGGTAESYLVGTGSDDVIAYMLTALGGSRDERPPAVLFPTPTFVMYGHVAAAHGYRAIGVPLEPSAFALDVDAMVRAIAEHRPNAVFLATPNNPTGNAFATEHVEALVRSDPGALFVIDEAYAAFAGRTLARLADAHPNVAILGTLSKIGFAAARIGFGRFPMELATEIDKARMPFNVSSLSLAIGELAVGELWPVIQAHVADIVRERERLVRELAEIAGLTSYASSANFVLVRFADPDRTARALDERGIVVRTFGDAAALRGCARITVGRPEENDRLLEALRSLKS